MNLYLILIAILLSGLFLVIKPKYKFIIAVFFMSSCFDLLNRYSTGIDLWDVGIIMLFLGYLQVKFTRDKHEYKSPLYEKILYLFIGWSLFIFVYSLIMYPLVPTIKDARHLVLGYMTYIAFISFFMTMEIEEFESFFNILYRITFFFVVIFLLQRFLPFSILKSLSRSYEGIIRSLPIFFHIHYFLL